MELKDFISETLTQLVEGIADAQSRVDSKGGRVCPYTHNKPEHKSVIAKTNDKLPVVAVDFDVLITAEDGTGSKGNVVLLLEYLILAHRERVNIQTNQPVG